MFQYEYDRRKVSVDCRMDHLYIQDINYGLFIEEYFIPYADAVDYATGMFSPQRGLISFFFKTKTKSIRQVSTDRQKNTVKEKFINNMMIKAQADREDSPLRKYLYENSPLRCELDQKVEQKKMLLELYRTATSDQMGMVYVRFHGKAGASIQINGSVFVYCSRIIGNVPADSPLRPTWIGDKTLAFTIPYGEWSIDFLRDVTDENNMAPLDAKPITINVNQNHKEIHLKGKMGLIRGGYVEE